jgi:hypothetical protein
MVDDQGEARDETPCLTGMRIGIIVNAAGRVKAETGRFSRSGSGISGFRRL